MRIIPKGYDPRPNSIRSGLHLSCLSTRGVSTTTSPQPSSRRLNHSQESGAPNLASRRKWTNAPQTVTFTGKPPNFRYSTLTDTFQRRHSPTTASHILLSTLRDCRPAFHQEQSCSTGSVSAAHPSLHHCTLNDRTPYISQLNPLYEHVRRGSYRRQVCFP